MVCHKKGEKVSTPLDKDGRGLHDLYDTYGQVPLTLRDSYIFWRPRQFSEYTKPWYSFLWINQNGTMIKMFLSIHVRQHCVSI